MVRTIRESLKLASTGRPAKSTGSIIEKLLRESIRLSQIQDIAGCRLVIGDSAEQERVVASLRAVFSGASVIDRRVNPSYGYRAVHVVGRIFGKPIEIQVRTSLQHRWAELSEKYSDVLDPAIKYGGGDNEVREMLAAQSELVASYEALEKKVAGLQEKALQEQDLRELQKLRGRIAEFFDVAVSWAERKKGENR